MRETNYIEKGLSENVVSIHRFRSANLHRTEICAIAYIICIWGGGASLGVLYTILRAGGLPSKNAIALSLGTKVFAFTGTVLSCRK